VVTAIELTPELSYYLLRENNGIYFGRFAYDAEDDIVFEHSLVGETCDRLDLNHSVATVIRIADSYDDATGKYYKLIWAKNPPDFLACALAYSTRSRGIGHILTVLSMAIA